jgi:glycosyltransferase involved in cell wall biosynthesis
VESALRQTVREIEVLIVGDGADAATTAEAERLAGSDDRVRFFPFAKGPRLGEGHRTAVLREARGDFIAYLADDDLWLPGHVEAVLEALRESDFVHARGVTIRPDQSIEVLPGDFAVPGVRERLSERWNFIPLSGGAHSRAVYERLPGGWETTPPDVWTDLHMWRRLLALPGCRATSTGLPTVLTFPSLLRRDRSLAERETELGQWAARLAEPGFARDLERRAFENACQGLALRDLILRARDGEIDRIKAERDAARAETDAARNEADATRNGLAAAEERNAGFEVRLREAVDVVHAMEATATWRLRDRLMGLRGLPRLWRWASRPPRT